MCLCPPGYSGRLCENRVPAAARHRGEAESGNEHIYRLVSSDGHINADTTSSSNSNSLQHQRLQSAILPPKNPCLTQRCKNNGTCVMSFSHAKNRFSFVCKCAPGFYGPLCDNSTSSTTDMTAVSIPMLESTTRLATAQPWLINNNRRVKLGYVVTSLEMLKYRLI